jgi:hypothetical protein
VACCHPIFQGASFFAWGFRSQSPRKHPGEGANREAGGCGPELVGYFSRELARTLNGAANDRDTTLQAILGEAIDLWLRENGKHPFGER